MIIRATVFGIAMVSFFMASAAAQGDPEPQALWPAVPPGAAGEGEGHEPTLTVFLPGQVDAPVAAVVVCPGGGYGHLAGAYEGEDVARWLVANGVAGIVLRYRHAPDYHHPIPLMDAQRAIRTVRANAEAWQIDSGRIGILGFSAGGHLAASTGTLYDDGDEGAEDPVERVSSRPDFMILMYPVISMAPPHGHMGSRRNLLGEDPSAELVERLSPEKQVNANTPPAFLVHGSDDSVVPVQNSLVMYEALLNAEVPVEMHLYEEGKHGFGMGEGDPDLSLWPDLCLAWFRTRGIIE